MIAAALARMARHRFGDWLIDAGVRLTHDAGPALTTAQEARIAAAVEAGRAVLAAGRQDAGQGGKLCGSKCRGR